MDSAHVGCYILVGNVVMSHNTINDPSFILRKLVFLLINLLFRLVADVSSMSNIRPTFFLGDNMSYQNVNRYDEIRQKILRNYG